MWGLALGASNNGRIWTRSESSPITPGGSRTWPLIVAPNTLRPMLSLFRRASPGKKDFIRVLGFGIGYPVSVLVPSRADTWLIDRTTTTALRLFPHKPSRLAERMARTLGIGSQERKLLEEAGAQYGMGLESAWGRVRCLRRRGWRPELQIDGMERLETARSGGAGTILWRMSFGSSLIVKIGLRRAGVPLVHLSMEQHGAQSDAWIARHILCPLYARSENWYLAERVVIPWEGGTTGVMRVLLNRLRNENAVVSIVGDNTGTQNITTPFLDGQAKFAIGAPALAWKAGASLLPVYSVRQAANRYRVVIEEPIAQDRTLDRKEFVRRSVGEFSQRMQDAIARYPGSWARWSKFWARRDGFLEA